MENRISIIDFAEQGNSIYIKLEVFDAAQDRLFAEEVRFLGNLLYGNLVHPGRSPLTDACRDETVEYVKNYFGH